MALWGGRFTQAADQRFKQFNDSLRFDYRLAEQDIVGSVAWSKALVTVGVLTAEEQQQLEEALNNLLEEVRLDPQQILQSDAEDIHSWVEGKLIDKVGQLGKKLHTGRSRNDQVATDLKLWCKETVGELLAANRQLQSALVDTAQNNQDAVMPGYTHLQRAQPVTFAHWCLAYVEMLARDESRLQDTLTRLDVSPLGSGALAGTAYEIDREQLAGWLGFASATRNSLDSVSDRDHVLELLSNASIGMVHLSRFAEDLIFRPRDVRLLPDAAKEKPGCAGADPRQMWPRAGRADRHDDDPERAAAGIQQRYAGRQRGAVRRARHLAGLSAYGRAGAGRYSGETSSLSGSGAAGLC